MENSQQRPSFEQVYMDFAEAISRRSTCKRLQVGTVITSTDFRKVLAVGYNGNASGLPNTCDRDEPGNCGCLHSEENAVINCDSPRNIEKIVFVTHLPCPPCAKRLINLGAVREVLYKRDYRSYEGLELLRAAGIPARQFAGDASPALRQATDADSELVYSIKATAFRRYVEQTWGSWDEEAQREHVRSNFEHANIQIITYRGLDVGWLGVERDETSIHVLNIHILPEYQNLGLGTSLLKALIGEGKQRGVMTRLRVLKVNHRAKDLYERLGFVVDSITDTHYLMRTPA